LRNFQKNPQETGCGGDDHVLLPGGKILSRKKDFSNLKKGKGDNYARTLPEELDPR